MANGSRNESAINRPRAASREFFPDFKPALLIGRLLIHSRLLAFVRVASRATQKPTASIRAQLPEPDCSYLLADLARGRFCVFLGQAWIEITLKIHMLLVDAVFDVEIVDILG